jgi:hypothetical protein
MTEQRRVRFDTLDYLGPDDLEFACEIWVDELTRAPWASREAMKLGAYLTRYILDPENTQITLSALEAFVQLTREDVRRSLALMQTFRAISAFTMERDGIVTAIRLSLLQQIRVLETRNTLMRLTQERGILVPIVAAENTWVPPQDPIPTIAPANEQTSQAA